MTTQAIFIRGYEIDYEKYFKYHNKPIPNNIEELCGAIGSDKLFIVPRSYDSIDIDDYGIYHMHSFFEPENILNVDELTYFLNQPVVRPIRRNFHSKFQIFTDYYDIDRGYYCTNDDKYSYSYSYSYIPQL